MVKQEEIRDYINSIPPAPITLKNVLVQLSLGELSKAASIAADDHALKLYLQNIVNKPIFGFKNDIKDIGQIFGVLGLVQAEQIVYNYMVSLLAPKKWELFDLNEKSFCDIQDSLSIHWKKILESKDISDKEIFSAISLLPASIIVCEALFKAKQEEVLLLRSVKEIDYSTILLRLSDMDLFDLCKEIAKAWEMPETISRLVVASSGYSIEDDAHILDLSKWMHLLFFYQLSQPICGEAGLNDFLDFNIDYVEDIYEDFQSLIMEDS
ncbi:HDOD domain-containing protein [Sulfurimonas sp. MAG313]|nr:HDOD domain-containing protein [Sulfurimonas sp. MAG313]MDF1880145.1 HDOD domain-containing protein [Sulfurimonas sp. MAG313]